MPDTTLVYVAPYRCTLNMFANYYEFTVRRLILMSHHHLTDSNVATIEKNEEIYHICVLNVPQAI